MTIRPLSPELAEKARVELNEDPKKVKDDIEHIKDWLTKQPHLHARTDDQWILTFLRGCKFSLERTKEKLDLFYLVRTTAPELHGLKHTDPIFQEILSLGIFLILPKAAGPDSPRTIMIRPGCYDPAKYSLPDIMSVSRTLMKIVLIDDDQAVIAGTQSIMDFEGVTLAHFLQMSPTFMKKMVVSGQDATPTRMKGFHYLNAPNWFEAIHNTMKTFLNEKNRNRINIHKNFDDLHKIIPKHVLPAEYGGDSGTVKEITGYWRKKIDEYSSWLEDDSKYGTDESKRPGKPKTAEELFGLEGSFRQLQFD